MQQVMNDEYDICIIGAGITGGTLAAYLGSSGLKVCVVEKTFTEQERIVGELLQPGGVQKLQEMGLLHLLNGFDAQPIQGYGLFMNQDSFQVSYSSEQNKNITGYGFRNHKFITSIRTHLQTLKNVTLLEGTVDELLTQNERTVGLKYTCKLLKHTHQINAKLTVACDGMFSVFREQLSTNQKKISSHFLGLVLTDCKLPYTHHGHVIIAEPAPCLLYPISSSQTRVLIDFPQTDAPRKSEELIHYLQETIAPQLPASVQASFLLAVAEGKFKVMPNHYVPAKPIFKPGTVLIGDSLNMRHPLTGGGMTAAFTDIQLLGNLLLKLNEKHDSKTEQIDTLVKTFYKQRHKQTATINILADALYGVMRNNDLKLACFNYLKRGGNYAQEPILLLSAISRNKTLLLKHFFAVALFGVKNTLTSFPTFKKVKQAHRMLSEAVSILSPLLLNEKPNTVTKYAFTIVNKLF